MTWHGAPKSRKEVLEILSLLRPNTCETQQKGRSVKIYLTADRVSMRSKQRNSILNNTTQTKGKLIIKKEEASGTTFECEQRTLSYKITSFQI
jgi:hypothetical protein